jgi:mannose-6-phosphate isomerase-like protein (cupin superfamily)
MLADGARSMIRKSRDMEREVRERMRDGIGAVEILHVFRSGELKGHTRLFARLRLPAGSSIGFHRHQGEEEIFYILSGRGEVGEGGPATPVQPGDAVLTGDGAGHSIANAGPDPLELLAVILVY